MTRAATSALRLLPGPEPLEQAVEAFGRRLAAVNAVDILEGITNFPPEVRESLRFGRTGVSRAETLFKAVGR